jgi:hypothetical protein
MGKYINQNNMTRLGLENLKPFATRGVLLDMVKVFQAAGKLKTNAACRKPCLDGGTVITPADLQAALKMYNVTLREGGHRHHPYGWGDLFQQFPKQNAGVQQRRSRHRQGSRQVADQPEGGGGRHGHLGGRGHSW